MRGLSPRSKLPAETERSLMHHSRKLMLLCVSFGVLAAILSAAGAGFWALVPAAGCAVTCAQMIVTMVRGGHHQPHS